MPTLAIIPARKGSKGIPRKNWQPVDGVPLWLNAARRASLVADRTVVSSDDPAITDLAVFYGFESHVRADYLADDETPLRVVVSAVCNDLEWDDQILLWQPTVPHLEPEDAAGLVACLRDYPAVTLAYDNQHQISTGASTLTHRVNRQQLGGLYVESGVKAWRHVADLNRDSFPYVMAPQYALDIDTPGDLQAAQTKPRVLIHAVGSVQLGSGHIRRAVTLADAMSAAGWDVKIDPGWGSDAFGFKLLRELGWEPRGSRIRDFDGDILIMDTLGAIAERPRIEPVVVAFEADPTTPADLIINALYKTSGTNVLCGPKYAVIRPEFLNVPYEVRNTSDVRVLAVFGGTDPSGLADKADALSGTYRMTVIRPGDSVPSMARLMAEHDILVTSAGRTVFEAAAVGIPTIVMAQNPREASHTHLGWEHGNWFLGMGAGIGGELDNAIYALESNVDLRRGMSVRSKQQVDGRGVQRIMLALQQALLERT